MNNHPPILESLPLKYDGHGCWVVENPKGTYDGDKYAVILDECTNNEQGRFERLLIAAYWRCAWLDEADRLRGAGASDIDGMAQELADAEIADENAETWKRWGEQTS